MKTANLTVKLDETTKKEFQSFCEKVGLNPSVAVNMFISYVVNNNELPFQVKVPNDDTIKAIKELENLKRSSDKKTYESFSDLLKEMNIKSE